MSAWEVWFGTDRVLTMRDGPGTLTGTALPRHSVPHAFLTAEARDATHEGRLRRLLEASADAEDFRARLRASGYRVVRR